MSLEQHNIDQGYKARLADLEVTPPVHAWAAIAAQLPNQKSNEKGAWWWGSGAASAKTPEEKSKRERVVFWWWTGALVALATLSMIAYYGMNNTNGQNPDPTPESSATSLLPIAATTENQNEALASLEVEEDCPEEATITTREIMPTVASSTILTRTPKREKAINIPSSETAIPFKADKIVLSTKSNLASPPPATILTPQHSKEALLLTDTKTTTPPSSVETIGLSLSSESLNALPFSSLALLETEIPQLPFGPGLGCEDFKSSAGWSFALRAFGGPGMIFQEYAATDATSTYKDIRDSVETQQLSVHGGLRFEATNDLGLFVRAGADYQMYRLNNQFLGPRSSRTVIDSVFMEDTQTWRIERSNVSVQEQRTVYNRQHAVVFTGGVGFRKTFGNVSPYLMAEAGYEILFKRKGLLVLPNETVTDLAEDDQGLYINDRPGFQYGGVLGVDFALTDRIEVGVSGHYKQLGGIRGSADLLDYDQSTAFGALNLRYTIK